jgi:hypothetical protein
MILIDFFQLIAMLLLLTIINKRPPADVGMATSALAVQTPPVLSASAHFRAFCGVTP